MTSVLIVDFDVFTTVGGGQTFYRTLIRRCPDIEFTYLSTGGDLARDDLPANARPVRLDTDADPESHLRRPSRVDLVNWLQGRAFQVAAAVAGRSFDVVDVPSYVPIGGLLNETFAIFDVQAGRFVVALLGWMSVGIRNGYAADSIDSVVDGVALLENDTLALADVCYAISDLYADHEPDGRQSIVIDMHDTLSMPELPAPATRAGRPPDIWFVGRLDRNKGPDVFVDVVAKVPRHLYGRCMAAGPDMPMLGGGSWSQMLCARAAGLGLDLTYAGRPSDEVLRETVFDGVNVVVVPSRTDTFNYVATDAVASGNPLMVSRRAGVFEFLSGRHPELPVMDMDPEEPDAAAERLSDFLEHFDERHAAYRLARERLDWPTFRPNFMLSVYRAAAQESTRTVRSADSFSRQPRTMLEIMVARGVARLRRQPGRARRFLGRLVVRVRRLLGS